MKYIVQYNSSKTIFILNRTIAEKYILLYKFITNHSLNIMRWSYTVDRDQIYHIALRTLLEWITVDRVWSSQNTKNDFFFLNSNYQWTEIRFSVQSIIKINRFIFFSQQVLSNDVEEKKPEQFYLFANKWHKSTM